MNYPIVILTFQGRNKYLKATLNWFKQNNTKKEIIVFTDFNAPKLKNIHFVEGSDKNWGINLANCIQLSNITIQHKYAFVLIEDLIPTSKVDFEVIDKSIEYMEQNQIDCTVFPTFKCFWGPTIGHIKLSNSSAEFYSIPSYFKFYSQLQPAIWNLDYFLKLLQINNNKNGDPWSFETLNIGGTHIVSEYCWPNMIGGYVESGWVNKKFLSKNIFNSFLPLKFRLILLADFVKQKMLQKL